MLRRRNVEGVVVAAAAIVLLTSCAEDLPPRSYVQTNVVDKTLFQGEWYYSWTVIDNRYTGTATDTLSTYVGDTSSDMGAGWAVARIRWVIDEDFLYAFRAHELTRGGNRDAEDGNWDTDGDGEPDAYRGEPVAAFAISSHFDIQRSYNPTTGEEMNVIEENTQDRRWYERRYMRVDWSVNQIMGYNVGILDLYAELFGLGSYEPSPMFVQPGSDTPESWQPQFAFTPEQRPCAEGANPPSDECSWEDAYMSQYFDEHGPNQLYYMSFVTQEIMTPGTIADPYSGQPVLYCQSVYSDRPYCTSSIIVKRHAFLRISDEHDYAPELHEDNDFGRFGLFRIERPTYDRVDSDNPADPRLGATDFLDYYSVLHNIWQEHHDAEGNVLPHSEREPRTNHVWLTAGWPTYLIRTGLAIAGEWGEVFMRLVRANQGIELPDPYYRDFTCNTNQECLDEFGPDSHHRSTCDQAVNRCRRPYNPLRSPESPYFYEGDYDCWIGTRDGEPAPLDPMGNNPHDPDNDRPPAERESDFDEEVNLAFQGSECMLVAHVNSCDVDPEAECEERGDMRYPFFSFVFSADTPFLGVATMRGDPVTGEFVTGDANFATWDMGWYRSRALQEYDILTGNLTEEQLMTGEDVRGAIDDLGRIIPPTRPLRDEQLQLEGAMPVGFSRELIDRRWGDAMQRAERLRGEEGRRAIYSDRVLDLAGTEVERLLTDNPDMMVLAGVNRFTDEVMSQPMPEEMLDRVSPMRVRLHDMAEMQERREVRHAERGECFGESNFTDYSVLRFVEEHLGYTRPQLTFALDRHVVNETVLHEFGHVIGLRHNFTGTVDIENFHPEYHEIVRNYPLPTCTEIDLEAGSCTGPDPREMTSEDPEDWPEMNYDTNSDGTLDREETRFLTRAQANVRRFRELAGIEQYWTSSLMDYTPAWYHRLVGLGRWDVAAILFNYGRLMEVYNTEEGDIEPSEFSSADGVRELWRYYRGGETCYEHSDCPYSDGGEMVDDMTEDQRASGIFQRCLPNELYPEAGNGYCSNTYDDLHAANEGGNLDRIAVEYRFCTDDRVADQSDCNRMDEGASYREIVMNLRENYHRQYFWNNFRRYRNNFPGSYGYRVVQRILEPLGSIYQHMFYRWASEGEEYRNDTGPLGFYDQYMASVDVMNFFAEIMATPDVGVYYRYPYQNMGETRYLHYENSLDWDEGIWDLMLYPGLGKYYYSDYRTGTTGIFYLERLGIVTDKIYALLYLSSRYFGLPYTIDEAYFVNFYDAFPEEMSYLFGNYAADQAQHLLPRISFDSNNQPTLEYMDLWMGDCSYRDGVECREQPDDDFGSMPMVDFNTFYMQFYGLIESLANFPVYWDARWERQLHIYVDGGEDGVEFADCDEEPDNPDCLVEGIDYIRYTSERFHRSYVAFAVEDDAEGQRSESYFFNMLEEAVDLQDMIADIDACRDADEGDTCGFAAMPPFYGSGVETRDAVRDRYRRRLSEIEGYIRYVLQTQQDMGIATWFGY